MRTIRATRRRRGEQERRRVEAALERDAAAGTGEVPLSKLAPAHPRQHRLLRRRGGGAVLAHVPGIREPAVRAAVAESRQLGGVHVAQQAAQGLGAPAPVVRVRVGVGLEEAVDAEAGAERTRRREAEEGGEPGDEVGEDAVGEEQRDEDPLEQRVREHPRHAVAPLAQRRGEGGAHARPRPRHGSLRHHRPRSKVTWEPAGMRWMQTTPTSQPGVCRGIQGSTKTSAFLPESFPGGPELDWSGTERRTQSERDSLVASNH